MTNSINELQSANSGKTPSEWCALGEDYDISGLTGPIDGGKPWPVYSYDRPAYVFWNGVGAALHKAGWSDLEIRDLLQSKIVRHELDARENDIRQLGEKLGREWSKYLETVRSF